MTRLMKGTGRLLVLLGFCLLIVAVSTIVILPVFLIVVAGYPSWFLTAYIPFLLIIAYDIGDDT